MLCADLGHWITITIIYFLIFIIDFYNKTVTEMKTVTEIISATVTEMKTVTEIISATVTELKL